MALSHKQRALVYRAAQKRIAALRFWNRYYYPETCGMCQAVYDALKLDRLPLPAVPTNALLEECMSELARVIGQDYAVWRGPQGRMAEGLDAANTIPGRNQRVYLLDHVAKFHEEAP